jgi:hypothetical protein
MLGFRLDRHNTLSKVALADNARINAEAGSNVDKDGRADSFAGPCKPPELRPLVSVCGNTESERVPKIDIKSRPKVRATTSPNSERALHHPQSPQRPDLQVPAGWIGFA